MPLHLHKINISHFRSYDTMRLDYTGAQSVVLFGANGAGKTNILEAISLLVPGKGLRGAELIDMKNRDAGAEDLWGIAAEVATIGGETLRIGTGLDRDMKRRVIRINGKDAKSQNELSTLISAVWLTPQMDRLFLDGPASRRKFIDRLVYAYEPDHVTRINRYDRNLRERMKLLQSDRNPDPVWLSQLEAQLAAEAIAIAVSRIQLIERLHHHGEKFKMLQTGFPTARMNMSCAVTQSLETKSAPDTEDALREKLKQHRALDRDTGRTQNGIHRSDFSVMYDDKKMPAAQSSTGEQKSLLVSIILSHAQMMYGEKGHVPLLLLDEVAAHLDDKRRHALFAFLATLNGQVFLTGTDRAMFTGLGTVARFYEVSAGGAVER